jgi:hypothetical protein
MARPFFERTTLKRRSAVDPAPHVVRMRAVAMLEEILAVWPVEVAP